MRLKRQIAYAKKVLPSATRRALTPAPRGPVHLIIALADHFEPSIVPEDGQKRAPRDEQERRMEWWSCDYPKIADRWRDADGRPFVHTYFYPAEQYDEGILDMLADHCHAGWGEVEIHLHHGIPHPDTAENTRRLLAEFRDRLAYRHGCLASEKNSDVPRYAFVHGNFALANSSGGRFCGVDSEMQILAETGCYADMTLPTGFWDAAQTEKINSVYECGLPLDQKAPHREGRDLSVGGVPSIFPLMIQGPLITDFHRSWRSRRPAFDNAAFTASLPPTVRRLALWKQAQIQVQGRTDWIFIKLHCHSMDPTHKNAVIGDAFEKFISELVDGAADRKETLHFTTAREMTNILIAACDGREGNPSDYRDYRLKLRSDLPLSTAKKSANFVSAHSRG
jgi:hypothetical protein